MVLQRQTVDIPIGQGLDEKTGLTSRSAGKLDALVNGRIDKLGTIETRPGMPAMPTDVLHSGSIAGGRRLVATKDETLLMSSNRAYAWMAAANLWQDTDDIPEAAVTDRQTGIRGYSTLFSFIDAIELGPLTVVAYGAALDGTGVAPNDYFVRVRIIDRLSRSQFSGMTSLEASSQNIRLCTVGSTILVLFTKNDGTYETLWALPISTTVGVQTKIVDEIWGGTSLWEATGCATNLWVAFSSCTHGGPGVTWEGVRVKKYRESDLAVQCTTDLGTHRVGGPIGVSAAPGANVYVAWCEVAGAVGLQAGGLNETNGAIKFNGSTIDMAIWGGAGPVVIVKHIAMSNDQAINGHCRVAYDLYTGGVANCVPRQIRCCDVTSGGSVSADRGITYRVAIASTGLYYGGKHYVLASLPQYDSVSDYGGSVLNDQYGAFLLELRIGETPRVAGGPPARVVARVATAQCGHETPGASHAPNLFHRATDTYGAIVPILSNARGPLASATDPDLAKTRFTEGGDIFTLQFECPTALMPINTGTQPVLSGGVPVAWDGLRFGELGFHHKPMVEIVDHADVGGQLDSGQDYQWCALFQAIDAKGVVQNSCPSNIVTWTHDSLSTRVTLRASYVGLTEHSDEEDAANQVRVLLYRTQGNGSVFHLVAVLLPDNTDADYPNLPWIEYEDGVLSSSDDATIASNPSLYTTGGILENTPCPAVRALAYHDSRIWVASSDDPDTVWFSKQHFPGEIPGFNELLRLQVPTGEAITSLLGWDDKLIVFCESSVWLVFGMGPNDSGVGSQYNDPPRLQNSELGCIDPRSLLHGPGGVYFQAASGIWRMGDDLQPKFVGAPVADEIAAHPTVVGACLSEQTNEALFAIRSPETMVSELLVHNYLVDQWSTWTPCDDEGNAYAYVSLAMVPVSGSTVPAVATMAGLVLRQTPGLFLDATGGYVTLDMTTSWLHLASVQGYQRIRQLSVVGQRLSAHGATVSAWFDYNESSYQMATQTGTTNLSGYVYPGGFNGAWVSVDGSSATVAPASEAALLTALNGVSALVHWDIHVSGANRYLRWTATLPGRVDVRGRVLQIAGITEGAFGAPFVSYDFSAADIAALLRGDSEQLQVHLPWQKCQSVKIRLQTNNCAGAGVRVTGLSLDLGVMKGQHKLGHGNRPPTAGA